MAWPVCTSQVMQTENMLYLVSEYAPHGEIFGPYTLPFSSAVFNFYTELIQLFFVTFLVFLMFIICPVLLEVFVGWIQPRENVWDCC